MLFVNAYNVIQGGGVNVVLNFLSYLIYAQEEVLAALPDNKVYREFANQHRNYSKLKIVWFNAGWKRYVYKSFVNSFYLNYLTLKYKVDKIYSLGNISFKSSLKQTVLIQNAYATLDDADVWGRFNLFSRWYLKSMKSRILKSIKYADRVLVQTEFMRNSLRKVISENKTINVIPNVLDISRLGLTVEPADCDTSSLRLLFLSKYYPHKNFEILYPLCRLIKNSRLKISITLTLDPISRNDRKVLARLKFFPDIIKNIGPVEFRDLPRVYAEHNAIFLPSLLESFSSNYIEAMYFGKLIFTSDREFAKGICGDSAIYFSPTSPVDIFEKLKAVITNPQVYKNKTKAYPELLQRMSSTNPDEVNYRIYTSI